MKKKLIIPVILVSMIGVTTLRSQGIGDIIKKDDIAAIANIAAKLKKAAEEAGAALKAKVGVEGSKLPKNLTHISKLSLAQRGQLKTELEKVNKDANAYMQETDLMKKEKMAKTLNEYIKTSVFDKLQLKKQ